jgi:predicted SnoaL-like aldol condensation-catalyzing enzyme
MPLNHEQKIEFLERLYREVLFTYNADMVDDFISPDYIQRSPNAEPGRDALKLWLRETKASHPQVTHQIHRMLVDGEFAAIHIHVKRSPDDRGMAIVDLFRFENDLIAEHWEVIQDIPENPVNPTPMF